ncbi:MAG: transglycosylase SLT domain-containing protein [Armatimonadota bacterium]|nr:transglycosylase SLT domain-containing protein [Armatimonadota bacterium]MDR7403792.1 transglycosylase SLT domain-containing protein [Armatimonadota bacterium]
MSAQQKRYAAVIVATVGVLVAAAAAVAGDALTAARQAHLAGRHAQAVALLRAYLQAHPADASAWVWLGASYYQLGAAPQAVASFRQALALRPSPEVALWLGAALVKAGRDDEARAAFRRAARSPHPQTSTLAWQWLRAQEADHMAVLAHPPSVDAYTRVVRWYNPVLSASQVDAIVRSVLYYSDRYAVDPRLVVALIAVESGFHIGARSPAGAVGLGQLMPQTWQSLGVNPLDPVGNIYGTVRWLRAQLDRFGGNVSLALAAYNAGHGAVTRYNGIPPYRETQWYVLNVLRLYTHLAGGVRQASSR